MPKIRGFKADLWTDQDFVELSPYARLLWLGMWNYCCDNGHIADKSKQIKMRVLPTDDVNCAELLRELEVNGRIVRKDGVITVPNFAKHQKPDKRYFQTCDVPGCSRPGEDSQRETRGGHTSAPRSPGSPHDEVNRSEVNRSEVKADKPAGTKQRASKLPKTWKPSTEHEARALAADLVLGREVEKFKAHAEEKGRTAVNWNGAFTRWLMTAEEYAGRNRSAAPKAKAHVSQLELPPDGLTPDEYAAWELAQRQKRASA